MGESVSRISSISRGGFEVTDIEGTPQEVSAFVLLVTGESANTPPGPSRAVSAIYPKRTRRWFKPPPGYFDELAKEFRELNPPQTKTRFLRSKGHSTKYIPQLSSSLTKLDSESHRRPRLDDAALMEKVKSELKGNPNISLARLAKNVLGNSGKQYRNRLRRLPGFNVSFDEKITVPGINGVMYVAPSAGDNHVVIERGLLYPPEAKEIDVDGAKFHVWKNGIWKVEFNGRVWPVGKDKNIKWELPYFKTLRLTPKELILGDVNRRNRFLVGVAMKELTLDSVVTLQAAESVQVASSLSA